MKASGGLLVAAPLLALAAPLAGQQPPQSEAQVIVYGEDPCPPSTEDEVVVCARRPEDERYRIPPALRERRDRRIEESWGARSEQLEEASRPERPNSCSVVGTGGQTGCAADLVRQWYNARRARRSGR